MAHWNVSGTYLSVKNCSRWYFSIINHLGEERIYRVEKDGIHIFHGNDLYIPGLHKLQKVEDEKLSLAAKEIARACGILDDSLAYLKNSEHD